MKFFPSFAPGALVLVIQLIAFVLSLFPSPAVAGNVVNRTIDDTFGDSQTGQLVTYLPSSSSVWQDETCVGCAILPDINQAFKETYHAATYNPGLGNMNITMQFNGTAIYVFFILANNAGDGITSLTEANFTLDGGSPQLFQHAPDLTTTAIDYNQLVFQQENLLNAQHTLVISTSGVNTNVYVNFDYAIYTHDDTDPLLPLPAPGSSSSPTTSVPLSTPISAPSSSPTSKPPSLSSSQLSSRASSSSGTSITTTTNSLSPAQSGSDLGSSTSSQKSAPIGAIVGGTIGGLAVLVGLVALSVVCLRRQRKPYSRKSIEAAGYIPPLMEETAAPVAVNPFITPPSSQNSSDQFQQYTPTSKHSHALASTNYSLPVRNGQESPMYSQDAYGGIASSQASGSGSGLTPVSNDGSRGRLISVTPGDHLSSPRSDGPLSSTSGSQNLLHVPPASGKVEAIRRARQRELDQRLRTVQQEMAFLASDFTGEKGQMGRRTSSVMRPPPSSGNAYGNSEAGEDLSMEEMREQLRQMRNQIAHLREQQQSAWAQGLSDDPPPGYEPGPDSS